MGEVSGENGYSVKTCKLSRYSIRSTTHGTDQQGALTTHKTIFADNPLVISLETIWYHPLG
jgi:hypothetical protein